MGTWGTHIPWAFTAPSATPDPVPKSLAEAKISGGDGGACSMLPHVLCSVLLAVVYGCVILEDS